MLNNKIDTDLKEALKARDTAKVSTLRFLKSAMKNMEIEKRKELTDDEIVAVIKRQIKQRHDSIEEFKKGNRQDLVDKEAHELKILQSYLPEELSGDKLRAIVRETISGLGIKSSKQMGLVIKEVMAKAKGRCDGKTASDIVKEELSKIESAG